MLSHSFLVGSNCDDVRERGGWIKEELLDWPDFVIELYRLMGGKVMPQLEKKVRMKLTRASIQEDEVDTEFKARMACLSEEFLPMGRDNLRLKKFDNAILDITLSKKNYTTCTNRLQSFQTEQPHHTSSKGGTF